MCVFVRGGRVLVVVPCRGGLVRRARDDRGVVFVGPAEHSFT